MDSPIYRFLRFWRHPDLLDDECKIDGSGAGAWRLLDNEWKKIGRSSHTLELEELGGYVFPSMCLRLLIFQHLGMRFIADFF